MRIIIDSIAVRLVFFHYRDVYAMNVNLKSLAVGDCGKITGFEKTGKAYRKRLLAMGLTPGTPFSITRFAPMGDPVEIKIRGFSLTLRKDEAAALLIERI
jgi:ferrous iron transport protein A